MKKVILLALALVLGGKWALAQDNGENNIKNFRFGLKIAPALTWYKPDDKKKFESGGVTAKFGYGLMAEFRLNKVASIGTGLEISYDGGKLNFLDTNYYYLSKDAAFLEPKDTASTTGFTRYRLSTREYKNTYLTIPLMLKLKTPEIGMLTYFGQFGVNTSFKLKSRVDDKVLQSNNGQASQTDIDNTSDMNLVKFALNIGAGAEWNLAGSTSLVFGINWYNGFSNALRNDSKYLFRTRSNDYNPTKQKASSNAIALTIGVLF